MQLVLSSYLQRAGGQIRFSIALQNKPASPLKKAASRSARRTISVQWWRQAFIVNQSDRRRDILIRRFCGEVRRKIDTGEDSGIRVRVRLRAVEGMPP
jgi:hypothetical protein